MKTVEEFLNMLGLRTEDKVTGFRGVVTSVLFTLDGNVMAFVTPFVNRAGKVEEGQWFDVGRMNILSPDPVMTQPAIFYA